MSHEMDRPDGPLQDGPGLVAGRYELEDTIARGGMGEVFIAFNRATQQRVALKRLRGNSADRDAIQTLFKLEYQTLAQLRHPNIIEVYEYGVDSVGPYYTMELLDGQDLQALAPIGYRDACRHLRDVAASLALLHTRRIVHRDVSPKNVRLTSDGRCKLIDFGAMAYAGVVADPVGTPPMIAPEALARGALDHRVDLYALGALAYWVLTGRHAYPAARIADLASIHRRPPKSIRSLVVDLPARLAHLIESLLHREPNARPPSAAYVIEALTSIGELPPQRDLEDAMSYVATPALVGRDREMARLRSELERLQEGRGGRLLLESSPGVGRTRVLSELALEARLAGVVVVELDAGRHRGNLDTATALVRSILAAVPEALGPGLSRERRILAHMIPELLHVGEPPAALPAAFHERRLALGQALGRLCAQLASHRPVLILLDDVHWADDASLFVLCEACEVISDRRVLVVASEEMAAVLAAGGALDRFNRSTRRMRLHGLLPGETTTLARGIFGEVPNVERLGRWMHAVSLGNPGQNVELASHLVERGYLQYHDGRWVLVEALTNEALPPAIQQALRARVQQLGPAARGLAEALALKRGPASPTQCDELTADDAQPAFVTLEELVGLGIVVETPHGYQLARELFRDLLVDRTPEARLRELHRRLSVVAAGEVGVESCLEAALHMLRAGDELRSVELTLSQLDRVQIDSHDVSLALDVGRGACEVAERHGYSLGERLRLRAHTLEWAAVSGAYFDQDEVDQTLRQLGEFAGLRLIRGLSRVVGAGCARWTARAVLALRRVFAPKRARGPTAREARALLCRILVSTAPARLLQGRFRSVQQLAEFARPLAGFPQAWEERIVERCCRMLELVSQGRYVRASEVVEQVLTRVLRAEAAAEELAWGRQCATVGHVASALIEARSAARGALDACQDIEVSGTRVGRRLAPALRDLAHTLRGEYILAEQSRRTHERQEVAGMSPLAEATVQMGRAQAGVLMGDAAAIKGCLDRLTLLARGDSEVEPSVGMVEACNLIVTGRVQEGELRARALCADMVPWSSPTWFDLRAILALSLVLQKRLEEALQLSEQTLAEVDGAARPDDLGVVALSWVAADALASLGRPDQAVARLDGLADTLARHGSPLLLGRTHFIRAQIALDMGDNRGYERYLKLVRARYGQTAHPVLEGHVAQLADQGRATLTLSSLPPPRADAKTVVATGGKRSPAFRDPLRACSTASSRAERCLELLVNRSRSEGGMLFVVQAEGLRLCARRGTVGEREPAERAVRDALGRLLEAHADGTGTSELHEAHRDTRVHPLACQQNGRMFAVAGVVLHGADLVHPGHQILERLAKSLLQAGDAHVPPAFQA
ncbi:MAG: serine/threonine-protein kinase [Myxococcales bacterium]|nr:serine/threonine-protein kinase [Myxococcales bacterium]